MPSSNIKIKVFAIPISPRNLDEELDEKVNGTVNRWLDTNAITKVRFLSAEAQFSVVPKIDGYITTVTIAYV